MLIPMEVPYRSIFSRAYSNTSASAHSGIASIKAFIIRQTRCDRDGILPAKGESTSAYLIKNMTGAERIVQAQEIKAASANAVP